MKKVPALVVATMLAIGSYVEAQEDQSFGITLACCQADPVSAAFDLRNPR